MVAVRYFDLTQPIRRDELPLAWRLTEAPFDRNGDVKQGYLYRVSGGFAAEFLDEFADRWPPRRSPVAAHRRPLTGTTHEPYWLVWSPSR
jgi:hypothetical protein